MFIFTNLKKTSLFNKFYYSKIQNSAQKKYFTWKQSFLTKSNISQINSKNNIKRKFHSDTVQKIVFKNFTIFHNNEESAKQTLEEVFINKPYQFESHKINPYIIDAGSNIGIATLFFKSSYPAANIICFEPDPNAFKVLELNIKANQLKNVKLINAALNNKEGKVNFYGQISSKNSDARGNSIIQLWGDQRIINDGLSVNAVKLSSYINSEIDFLKLDIEGAEELVLTELGDKLKYVRATAIEYHEAKGMEKINKIDRIKLLLEKYNFNYKITPNDLSILPASVKNWSKNVEPALSTIQAYRR